MATSYVKALEHLKVEHLPYIEKDLDSRELVSLGFLLFGDDINRSSYITQMLVTHLEYPVRSIDLLAKYVEMKRDGKWKKELVEALAIIGAKRILRKLGFEWDDLLDLLPNVAELRVDIHPLLKALYIMCESLTPNQAQDLVLSTTSCSLPFQDYSYLEIFLLDWLRRGVIKIGNKSELFEEDIDLKALTTYFKLNEMDATKELLERTINYNASVKAPKYLLNAKSSKAYTDCMAEQVNRDPDSCYQIRPDNAGYVLIFNQVNFPVKARKREGSNTDKYRIVKTFKEFGYIVKPYDDLKLHEINQKLQKYILHSKNYDSLIVFILSHGNDGLVYSSDWQPLIIDEVLDMLCHPLLEKKPKMLFIQACQDNERDKEYRNNEQTKDVREQIAKAKKKIATAPPTKYADTIRGMATISGHASFRYTITGSWYIEALCQVIDQLGDKEDMVKILTETTKEVLKRRGEKDQSMLPTFSSTLAKTLYLPARRKKSQ